MELADRIELPVHAGRLRKARRQAARQSGRRRDKGAFQPLSRTEMATYDRSETCLARRGNAGTELAIEAERIIGCLLPTPAHGGKAR